MSLMLVALLQLLPRRRNITLVVALLLTLTQSLRAGAQSKQACADAYDRSQVVRSAGQLVEARQLLRLCAQDSCPEVVKTDCAGWLAEVEAALPSVVFALRDADGRLVSDARVFVDDQPVQVAGDGRAIPLDPGSHRIRFETQERPAVTLSAVVVEGVKAQLVEAHVPPQAAGGQSVPGRHDAGASRRAPTSFWLALGGGTALIATSAVLLATGAADARHLRDSCAPHCTQGQVDDVRLRLTLADVTGGAGLAVSGLAAYLFLSRAPVESRATVGAALLPGGAQAAFRTTF